ncbi:DUF808 family protein [Halobacteriovorax sp. HLS]|uniref:DUF808 family protein n=1 Tax=Halobacteriovorax sp. HLS TaxID=2234000 RepID=UPI000FDB0494|nr:DUF808 family protein [Halobacteriovorax sp. HLS]
MAYSLLALIDDVAAVLDDVGVMTKVALKKTSAVMSDDLAVNANQVDGAHPTRELPIVWKIFKGSLINKVIAISLILVINLIYPPLNTFLLICGGLYLAYEGAHKVLEYFVSSKTKKNVEFSEKEKIAGAIRTDLVLSFEIIIIAKSYITGQFLEQLLTLSVVGILASIIIYGLVAVIVKIDDLGCLLVQRGFKSMGLLLVTIMPYFMKLLSIVGTIAMFLVAGGIFTHAFHLQFIEIESIQNAILGIIVGLVVCTFEMIFKKLIRK